MLASRERACVLCCLACFGKFDAPRRAIEAADRVAGNIAAVRRGEQEASNMASDGEPVGRLKEAAAVGTKLEV